jgi:hypothetical protein
MGSEAIQLVPLKVSTSPVEGATVKSTGVPFNLSTDIACCVPLTSPRNGPMTFHAVLA